MNSETPSMTVGISILPSSPVARSNGNTSANGTPKSADIKKTDKENITPETKKDQEWKRTTWSTDDVSIVSFIALQHT